jgi:EmrB/QacA subfamily drug resistance transporter
VTAPGRARLLSPAMLGVASGAVLVPLNSTMLAVALPSVMDEFSIGPETVSSLVTLYLGAVTVALPASGSLGDRFGQRRVFLVGVVAFALSSLLAAASPSFELLALARVFQAVSGALVSTASVALVRAMSPPDRRGAAFGTFDMLVSTSAAVGPFVGGVLVGAFGWRSLFVIAVPVALFAAVVVGLVVRPDRVATDGRSPRARPIDIRGLVLLAALLIALLAAIRAAGDGGLGSVAAIAVLPLLFLFVRFELASDHPAVDPRLFTVRPFAAAVLGVLGATVILHGAFILVPLLVEELLHGDARTAGLVLLAISAVGAVAAPIGGRLSDRYGRRLPVVAGSLCLTAGLVLLWWFAADSSAAVIALLLGIVGLGLGLSGSPRQAAAMDAIPADRVGMAAGTYYTGRYLGGVLGASLAGAVLGATVTGAGVTLGFGLLAIVGVAVVIVSFGLPDRPLRRAAAGT